MKIIGHTQFGYVAEVSKSEVATITGKDHEKTGYSAIYSHTPTIPIGATIEVTETYQHLATLMVNDAQRQKLAEQFRAMATMIEHTPSALQLPPVPEAPQIEKPQ